MVIKASLDNGKDKQLSRSSDDGIDVRISVEVSPRCYKEYTLSLINLDEVGVGVFWVQADDWDSKQEIAMIDFEYVDDIYIDDIIDLEIE